MTLGSVVPGARGMSIAQRGAHQPLREAGQRTALFVGPVRSVDVPDTAPLESRRTDLVVWRRHWSEADRLVVDFIDIALVEVDDKTGMVIFDRELDAETEQHLLLDHVLPLVLARRGELVLHGAVISRDGVGVILVGESGAGKSTMTAFAWQQGWTVGGDDGAVVSTTVPPMVEPTYASVRLTPFSADLLRLDAAATSAIVGKRRVSGEGVMRFRQEPVELAVIAFVCPVSAAEPARFAKLDGVRAHAKLLGSTFHADLSVNFGLPAIMEGLAALTRSTTVGLLDVPRGLAGLHAADLALRRQLGEHQAPQ